MPLYVHFIIACLICEICFIVIHRKSSNLRQLFGMFFIPASLYFFVYLRPFLDSLDWLGVYISSFVCFLGMIFLCSLTFEKYEAKKGKMRHVWILFFLLFILISLIYGIPWLIKAFPLDNPEAIVFTLMQDKAGTDGFVWDLIWKNILKPTLGAFVPFCVAIFLLSMSTRYSKKTWCFRILRYKMRLYSGENIWVPVRQLSTFLLFFTFFVFCIIASKLMLPLVNLCKAYLAEFNSRQNSQLYLEEYVFPDSVYIKVPQEKKNLIYIMMESMETNFEEYTPEINKLSAENVSFLPGGVDLIMTNWTMAAQVSKLCAIPLYLPYGFGNDNVIDNFLPNIKCLTDILAENGYNQMYVQGSDGSFSSKKTFWNQHSVNEFHDFPYYKKKKIVSEEKEIFWGVTDKTLYRLMQNELNVLARDSSRPFALYAITVDTHFPDGYLSDGCAVSSSESSQYPSVLRCASRQIDDFLKWAENQSWYENTLIVVVGDHTWPTFTELLNLPKEAPLYWVNVFINAPKQPKIKNRSFSSFDMFPTVLEAMNMTVEGHRLGLGTSLFSSEKTLLERMPKTTLDSMLKIKSYQYDYFMQGGSFWGK